MRPRIVIALVTLGACLMLMTGSAQAANFTAGSYPATVFGEQAATPAPNTGIEGGTVFGFEKKLMTECATASFSGPLSAASSTLTVTPTLEGCRLFEVIGGSVNPDGCETRFHAGAGSGDEFSGTMDIVCPGTNKIAVVGTGCEVRSSRLVRLPSTCETRRSGRRHDELDRCASFTVAVSKPALFSNRGSSRPASVGTSLAGGRAAADRAGPGRDKTTCKALT